MLLTRYFDQRPFSKVVRDALIANGDVKKVNYVEVISTLSDKVDALMKLVLGNAVFQKNSYDHARSI